MTPQFPRIFFWHMVRPLRRHPLLAGLNVLSVALGIAVYLAIQIANHSANRSFAAGIDLVAGRAHLEVRGDVDETFWPNLARQPGVQAVTGVVEGVMTFPQWPGEYVRVLGVDLFSGEPFRTFQIGGERTRLSIEQWMGEAGVIALTAEFAQAHGVSVGDRLRVLVNSETRTVTVGALLSGEDSPGAVQSRFAVMDIGWAQELFGRQGRLSSLQILLENPARAAEVAAQLNLLLPPSLRAEPPRQRSSQIQNMLSAFQLNLTALSMVSLLVGIFLIYNTISASVARRRVEIGILRALGATRWEVRALFLGEAAVLGAVGIAVGMIGGVWLAQSLTGAVGKTVSSLYLLLSIERSWFSPLQFATAAVLGFGTVLTGAWRPANEAAGLDPIGALSLGTRAEQAIVQVPRWGWMAVAALAAAGITAVLALRVGPPAWAFLAAFFILAGFAFLSPGATWQFGRAATHFPRLGAVWRLAADHLRQSIHRNGITVAALAAAIAMMVGLVVMIFSFRSSVNAWIDRGIVADLFIAPASNETIGLEATVPPAAVDWLRARAEVASVDTFRELFCAFQVAGRPDPAEQTRLAVVDGQYRGNLTFVGGGDVAKMERVLRSRSVAVTEPFARKHRVGAGDRLILATPRGAAEFEVAGVYSDYTRDQGVVLMARGNFDQWWADPLVQSLAVYLRPGAGGDALAEGFRAQFSRDGEFLIYSNRALRERIFSIFDQTFAVTYILRTVALLVAIAGIFLSITTLIAEREREIGVLRAVGASRGQVLGFLMTEAGMIGTVATVLGTASGLILACALTWVVNPAFFGWTITLRIPWASLLATPLWILPAALLAAWYPAWQATRKDIAAAVREE